jgi:hypothetical protein
MKDIIYMFYTKSMFANSFYDFRAFKNWSLLKGDWCENLYLWFRDLDDGYSLRWKYKLAQQ